MSNTQNRMLKLDEVKGGAFNTLIADQLQAERSLSASLAQRGLAVVTTSGTLATLVFAFTALTTTAKQTPFHALPLGGRLLMVVSIAAFVVAAVLGLLANIWSNDQPEVPDNRLHELLDDGPWRDTDAVEGARKVAQEVERNIQEYRRGNRRSLRRIRLAVGFEILAAALLAGSVGWIVFTG